MNLKDRKLWQVAAGDNERKYDDICLDYNVMMIGPGRFGRFDEKFYAQTGDTEEARRQISRIRPFYRDARCGDIVLLRLGTDQVLAVGEIADEEPEYLEEFGDIDGWDLRHVRRVRWFPNTKRRFPVKTFGGQVRTFARVRGPKVCRWVEALEIQEERRRRTLDPLPPDAGKLKDERLRRLLFLKGRRSKYIERLLSTLESIRRVAKWYEEKRPEGRPSESETVTYLVIPLLFALGWSHQSAAVEWKNIDVALFDRMPPTDATLTCIIEAKSLKKSVFSPLRQARKYAGLKGRTNCKRLIVTDGVRYACFTRQAKEPKLWAYLNILRMREKYPLLGCKGAVEAIIAMAR